MCFTKGTSDLYIANLDVNNIYFQMRFFNIINSDKLEATLYKSVISFHFPVRQYSSQRWEKRFFKNVHKVELWTKFPMKSP